MFSGTPDLFRAPVIGHVACPRLAAGLADHGPLRERLELLLCLLARPSFALKKMMNGDVVFLDGSFQGVLLDMEASIDW